MLFIGEASWSNVMTVKRIFRCFELALSLKVNFFKSCFAAFGVILCSELDLYQFLFSFLLISDIDCVEDQKNEMQEDDLNGKDILNFLSCGFFYFWCWVLIGIFVHNYRKCIIRCYPIQKVWGCTISFGAHGYGFTKPFTNGLLVIL